MTGTTTNNYVWGIKHNDATKKVNMAKPIDIFDIIVTTLALTNLGSINLRGQCIWTDVNMGKTFQINIFRNLDFRKSVIV